ncbi:MAG: ATP-binding protein [bacterium]
MIYVRDLISTIKPFLKRQEYIAIIGPRQSGKTTFLELLKSYLIEEMRVTADRIKTVTFEDRKLLAQFESEPVSFVQSYLPQETTHPFFLMIDEFQYAVDGGQKLKLIYDTVKEIKIIITGSSSLDIKAQVGKYLVGRMLTFSLYPFNFKEYLNVHDARLKKLYIENNTKILQWMFNDHPFKIKSEIDIYADEFIDRFEEFCIWGGYPAVVIAQKENIQRKLLSDIYNSYILKDIKTLLELATERKLYLLSQHLAAQIGNILVYQNLGQASGLDYRNLKKHLNILEQTFMCKTIRPFFRNRQKELTKNPKIYFLDMGFRNNLMENFNGLSARSDAGAIVENAMFIRLNEILQGIEKINFWRTKAGAEVDFIVQAKNNILPLEIKYSNFNTEKISRSLASFIDSFNPEYTIVLTRNFWGSTQKNKTKILFIPVYYM